MRKVSENDYCKYIIRGLKNGETELLKDFEEYIMVCEL